MRRAWPVVVVGMLALGTLHAGDGIAPDTIWSSATRFRMSTRALLFISGRVDFRFRQDGSRLILDARSQARLFGASVARSRSVSIVDAATFRALEHQSFTPKDGRHFIFDDEGYTVRKLEPTNGYEAPLADWRVTGEAHYAYPTLADGTRAPVYDYFSVLLGLRRLHLAQTGDQDTIWVATTDGPQRYLVRVDAQRDRSRTYKDLATGRKVEIMAHEFRLLVNPANQEPGTPGFLGTHGETEIWTEAETKLLIEVSGKIPRVPGRIVVELDGFERPAPVAPQADARPGS